MKFKVFTLSVLISALISTSAFAAITLSKAESSGYTPCKKCY